MDFDTSKDEYTLVEDVRSYIVEDGKLDNLTMRNRSIELIEKYSGPLKVSLDDLSNYALCLTAIDIVRQHAVSDKPSIILAISAARQAEKCLDDMFGPEGVQSALCETVQSTKLSFKKNPKVEDADLPKRQTKVSVARRIASENPGIKINDLAKILMAELDLNESYAKVMAYNVLSASKKGDVHE